MAKLPAEECQCITLTSCSCCSLVTVKVMYALDEIAAISIIHHKSIFLSGGGGSGAVNLYSRGVIYFIQSLSLAEESIIY